MKQIVVVSGKGGSGKTFVTSSLASLAEGSVLADCDVDAANLHLMLSPREASCVPFVSGSVADVDAARCTGCGACEPACRFRAIHLVADDSVTPGRHLRTTAVVDDLACEGCGVCELVCPANAITSVPQEIGSFCKGVTDAGPLVYAELRPGSENSGKLVEQVRRTAKEIARTRALPWVLIDGPPGTGCAARSAITGTDYVLAVAEPTASGIHDLTRLLELVRHFRIDVGLVINKATISPDHTRFLRQFAASEGISILGEIPFSRSIPEALTRLIPYPIHRHDGITAEIHRIRTRLLRAASA